MAAAQPAAEPRQLVGSLDAGDRDAGDGMVGYVRPLSMAPPKGAPGGSGPKAPPTALQRPSERSQLASRACDMIAPQKLATMSQLMRRVAAATDGLHVARSRSTKGAAQHGGDGGGTSGGGRTLLSLGSVAKFAYTSEAAGSAPMRADLHSDAVQKAGRQIEKAGKKDKKRS